MTRIQQVPWQPVARTPDARTPDVFCGGGGGAVCVCVCVYGVCAHNTLCGFICYDASARVLYVQAHTHLLGISRGRAAAAPVLPSRAVVYNAMYVCTYPYMPGCVCVFGERLCQRTAMILKWAQAQGRPTLKILVAAEGCYHEYDYV